MMITILYANLQDCQGNRQARDAFLRPQPFSQKPLTPARLTPGNNKNAPFIFRAFYCGEEIVKPCHVNGTKASVQ
jgi:hypothetical protein